MKRKSSGLPATVDCLLSDERGLSLLVQALLVVPILVAIIGLTYDLGAVAIVQARAQDAIDLAAQDAAKELNVGRFTAGQEVTLSQGAVARAQARLAEYSGGQVQLVSARLVKPDPAHTGVFLSGVTVVPTRFLRTLGVTQITRRVAATAIPAFGIAGEGQ